ncbi:MAG: hypothetical protein ACM4D3_15170 [Candidatus Sericytochromatia bacterium]
MSAVVIAAVVAGGSPSDVSISIAPPSAAAVAKPLPSNPLPNLGGPRSQLVPEVTLPQGARPYSGQTPTPAGFEFWEVPGTHHDLVAQMRSELPVFGSLNGMPWCGELSDAMTSWAWGSTAETIGVSLIDGGVLITRLPQPEGCHP